MHFITADLIFDGTQFLPNDTLLVVDKDRSIIDIKQKISNENIQKYSGCLLPGFVNTHCHLELSHLKNVIPQHTGLVDFLLSVNAHRNTYTQEQKQKAIQNAELEIIAEGIVAVGDISNGLDTFEQKSKKEVTYHTFVECVGLLNQNAQERFNSSFDIYSKFATLHPSSLVLHAPYSVSDQLIKLVMKTKHPLQSIHNQESKEEDLLFEKGSGEFLKLFEAILGDITFFNPSGKRSIQTWLPKFDSREKIILVHNTFTSEQDIKWANHIHPNLTWCICPSANLYIENTLPDISSWCKHGCFITIGTDSLASNHRLSIINELQILNQHFSSIPLAELLQWATLNGAKALNMDDKLGTISIGKQPGILQIENMLDENRLPLHPILKRLY